METSLPLLKGSVTLQEALEEDKDIVRELSYPEKRLDFWVDLYERRFEIEQIVSRHLNIPRSAFRLGEVQEWIHGSFNACVLIHIAKTAQNVNVPPRAVIRFPLPYKIGEAFQSGNVEEKLRCEVATYIWLQSNCPVAPVPRLFGFGFPGGKSFTSLKTESLWNRLAWYFRYSISWLSGRTLSPYSSHSRHHLLDLGYLIIEHVEGGKMLSDSWEHHRHDPNRRRNLFRDLSRIMLCLAKVPLPRIGSWTIDDSGIVSLSNRPLTILLHESENLEIPTGIPRDLTYTSVEPYLLDLIACHDNRVRYQPNSIHDQSDGLAQLAALTAMRTLLSKFTNRRFRQGPFVLSLTDMHQSNIFVDENWHVTNIIDLEWACVHPLEMLSPPHWLSDQGLDQIATHLGDYEELHKEFVDAFEIEELTHYRSDTYTRVLRDCWRSGSFWYFQALDCPSALLALFLDHIQPRFANLNSAARDEFSRVLMPYWDLNATSFISSKLEEEEEYRSRLRELFANASG